MGFNVWYVPSYLLFDSYCMPSMLDEVSEGDWLCEGCKLHQNASVKRVDPISKLEKGIEAIMFD